MVRELGWRMGTLVLSYLVLSRFGVNELMGSFLVTIFCLFCFMLFEQL